MGTRLLLHGDSELGQAYHRELRSTGEGDDRPVGVTMGRRESVIGPAFYATHWSAAMTPLWRTPDVLRDSAT